MSEQNGSGDSVAVTRQIREAANLPIEVWPEERIKTIAKTCVPKNVTVSVPELAMFLATAQRYDLDPIIGEIWLTKDDSGKVIVLTGRSSYIKAAQRDPGYLGFRSGVVYSKDEFRIEIHGDEITIHHLIKGMDRGVIAGAYCVAYHRDRKPVLIVRRWSDYSHLQEKKNWKRNPDDMIETRCITAALRRQYTLAGLYTAEEFGPGEIEDGDGDAASRRSAAATRARMADLRERMAAKGEPSEIAEAEWEAVTAAEVETKDVPPEEMERLRGRYFALLRERRPDLADSEYERHEWQESVMGEAHSSKWSGHVFELAIAKLEAIEPPAAVSESDDPLPY